MLFFGGKKRGNLKCFFDVVVSFKIEDLFLIGGADISLEKNRSKIFKKNLQKTESLKRTISTYIKKYRLKNPKDFHKIAFLFVNKYSNQYVHKTITFTDRIEARSNLRKCG